MSLLNAVASGDVNNVLTMLNSGVSVHQTGPSQETALHVAAARCASVH